jgi:hypothetical protein
MTIMKIALAGPVLALAMLLAGCGAAAPETIGALNTPLAKSTARLKFYRPEGLVGALSDARVKVDGKDVASLANGDSKEIDLPVGAHKIVVDHWGHPNVYTLDLQTKPGRIYVLEVTVRGDAAVAGALFGMVGVLAEAAANENGGSFQVRLVEEKPLSAT